MASMSPYTKKYIYNIQMQGYNVNLIILIKCWQGYYIKRMRNNI